MCYYRYISIGSLYSLPNVPRKVRHALSYSQPICIHICLDLFGLKCLSRSPRNSHLLPLSHRLQLSHLHSGSSAKPQSTAKNKLLMTMKIKTVYMALNGCVV